MLRELYTNGKSAIHQKILVITVSKVMKAIFCNFLFNRVQKSVGKKLVMVWMPVCDCVVVSERTRVSTVSKVDE